MPKINKYLYGYKLYVNYGQGWEYETFEETRKAFLTQRRAYAENCAYPQKWTRGRELNPAYERERERERDARKELEPA